MTEAENPSSIMCNVSNTEAPVQSDVSTCDKKKNVSGRKRAKQERTYMLPSTATKPRRRAKKRGRKKDKRWWLKSRYQRRHCAKRLRRCEVENLLAADRFASRTGRRLSSFITIRWHYTHQGEANLQRRWSALLNALRIWASRRSIELTHCWVHENPFRGEPAFHTHMLANIPATLRDEMKEWLVKRLGDNGGAIDVQPRTWIHWHKPDDRISYLCKGTDRATAMKYRLIRKHGWDFKQGIVPFRRSGTSRNINTNSRAADAASEHIEDIAA